MILLNKSLRLISILCNCVVLYVVENTGMNDLLLLCMHNHFQLLTVIVEKSFLWLIMTYRDEHFGSETTRLTFIQSHSWYKQDTLLRSDRTQKSLQSYRSSAFSQLTSVRPEEFKWNKTCFFEMAQTSCCGNFSSSQRHQHYIHLLIFMWNTHHSMVQPLRNKIIQQSWVHQVSVVEVQAPEHRHYKLENSRLFALCSISF